MTALSPLTRPSMGFEMRQFSMVTFSISLMIMTLVAVDVFMFWCDTKWWNGMNMKNSRNVSAIGTRKSWVLVTKLKFRTRKTLTIGYCGKFLCLFLGWIRVGKWRSAIRLCGGTTLLGAGVLECFCLLLALCVCLDWLYFAVLMDGVCVLVG